MLLLATALVLGSAVLHGLCVLSWGASRANLTTAVLVALTIGT